MKNYSVIFKNTMDYPSSDKIRKVAESNIVNKVNAGELKISSASDLESQINAESAKVLKERKDEYNKKEAELRLQFKQAVLYDTGFDEFPEAVRELAYAKAYDEGHSYGFNEVYNHLVDLYDFVDGIIKAIKNN